MRNYPYNFSTQKEYESYYNCLSKLKVGDKVQLKVGDKIVECVYVAQWKTNYANSPVINVIAGMGSSLCKESPLWSCFFRPSKRDKELYLKPAKKICPDIMITNMHLISLLDPVYYRIVKIIKYNGKKEKEKEKRPRKKKSICVTSLNEETGRTNEA